MHENEPALNKAPLPFGIDKDLLKQVFVTTIGEVRPEDVPEYEVFFIEVVHYCYRWIEKHGMPPSTPIVFIYSERIDLDPSLDSFEPIAGWSKQQPLEELPGALVLTSSNLRVAYSRSAGAASLPDLVAEITDLGLEARVAAVFVPSAKCLAFHAQGVANRGHQSGAPSLSQAQRQDPAVLLDLFHDEYTKYPDGLGNCWISATNRVLFRNAEMAIRNSLYVYLARVHYRTEYIVREMQLPNGRSDIWIFGKVLGKDDAHCVIELKVLRSRSSTWAPGAHKPDRSEEFNKRYVERGARQVAGYKQQGHATRAFLCCYDGRVTDTEVDGIPAYAQARGVEYRRYFMEPAFNP
jgi:hypothetical protein